MQNPAARTFSIVTGPIPLTSSNLIPHYLHPSKAFRQVGRLWRSGRGEELHRAPGSPARKAVYQRLKADGKKTEAGLVVMCRLTNRLNALLRDTRLWIPVRGVGMQPAPPARPLVRSPSPPLAGHCPVHLPVRWRPTVSQLPGPAAFPAPRTDAARPPAPPRGRQPCPAPHFCRTSSGYQPNQSSCCDRTLLVGNQVPRSPVARRRRRVAPAPVAVRRTPGPKRCDAQGPIYTERHVS